MPPEGQQEMPRKQNDEIQMTNATSDSSFVIWVLSFKFRHFDFVILRPVGWLSWMGTLPS
jgi:hypothetical protein